MGRSVEVSIGKPVYESKDELKAKEGSRAFQIGSLAWDTGIGGAVGMFLRLDELGPMAGYGENRPSCPWLAGPDAEVEGNWRPRPRSAPDMPEADGCAL